MIILTLFFSNHKLLKIQDIIFWQSCIFVFKSLHVYPNNTTYELLSHNLNSRRPNDLRIPYCRTVQAQRSVSVRGVRNWNSLPQEVKSSTTISFFKSRIKSLLFQKYEWWILILVVMLECDPKCQWICTSCWLDGVKEIFCFWRVYISLAILFQFVFSLCVKSNCFVLVFLIEIYIWLKINICIRLYIR